jgi:hypothetical protein
MRKLILVSNHNQCHAWAPAAGYVTEKRIHEISRISEDQVGSLKTSKRNMLRWHVHGEAGTASARPTYEEKAVRRRQIEERKAKPSIWGGMWRCRCPTICLDTPGLGVLAQCIGCKGMDALRMAGQTSRLTEPENTPAFDRISPANQSPVGYSQGGLLSPGMKGLDSTIKWRSVGLRTSAGRVRWRKR